MTYLVQVQVLLKCQPAQLPTLLLKQASMGFLGANI